MATGFKSNSQLQAIVLLHPSLIVILQTCNFNLDTGHLNIGGEKNRYK